MSTTIVAISGPTSAGKTYFSKQLIELAKNREISCVKISTDEFYSDQSGIPMEERVKVNYDLPQSIDNDEFKNAICQLAEGKSVKIPVYDFSKHVRTGQFRKINPVDLIIVEGIFSLTFEDVLPYYTLSIYVELEPDLRLIRRIIRDTQERGRSLEAVFNQYIETVKPTQEEYVRNDREKADIILLGNKDHSIVYDLILKYCSKEA